MSSGQEAESGGAAALVAVLRAAEAAARWHAHQTKKGAAGEPYINHLLEVASLVAEATEGSDTDLVVAALLHDAMEHQDVPREVIDKAFGPEVGRLVADCTDDRSLEEPERKRRQVEEAPRKSRRAKLVMLADKTSNVRRMGSDPPPDWSVRRRLDYVAWAREVVAGLRSTHAGLEAEFDRAADAAERSSCGTR